MEERSLDMSRDFGIDTNLRTVISVLFFALFMASNSVAYRPGDIVPMSKMGQYHSVCILEELLPIVISY